MDFAPGRAVLRGVVTVDEADPLLSEALGWQDASVDLQACTHVHPAVLQVLAASRATVTHWPQDPQLAAWLATLLPGAPDTPLPTFPDSVS